MKLLFSVLVLFSSLWVGHVNAQDAANGSLQVITVEGFIVKEIKNNLVVVWNSSAGFAEDNWEVQASADGKNFKTIGYVLGADPAVKDKTSYAYKQPVSKIGRDYRYYRVMQVSDLNGIYTSEAVLLTK